MTGQGPWPSGPVSALGLMSGTSLDGIDAAIITTDGERVFGLGPHATYPYEAPFRAALRALLGRSPGADATEVVRALTLLHADAVRHLLEASAVAAESLSVIGFHGHTVLHRPELRMTRQIGDGQLLADETGIPVVEDFRSADVAAGGHGAPLASLYHCALAEPLERPVAVLNIGGVANVTWIGAGDGADAAVLAFDTGPGNALVDDWVARVGSQRWDEGGRLARSGRVHPGLVKAWLEDPYFFAPPPKSLDRDRFAPVLEMAEDLSAEDGAATLTAFTVEAVRAGLAFLPQPPRRWLVCGGGRRNATIMAMLAATLAAPVDPIDTVGWNGDALEAQAFAFLAVRSLRGLPLSVPTTTGVPTPLTGGVVRHPQAIRRIRSSAAV